MLQALMLVSCALWVGFGFQSIYPCCALEMPQDSSLGPAFAQKGTRSWLICQPHGDKETWPGGAKMPLHSPVYTTERCPQWALALCAKVERKFPDEVWFWTENGAFIYSFVWYVPFLPAEFPIQTWLFSSQHECSLPEGERNVFQAIPEQQQQLTPVTPKLCCALSPLRKPCFSNGIVCCLGDDFHCVNPALFLPEKKSQKIGTISRKTGNNRHVCLSVIALNSYNTNLFADLIIVSCLVIWEQVTWR